jgi:WD40 repeat protein
MELVQIESFVLNRNHLLVQHLLNKNTKWKLTEDTKLTEDEVGMYMVGLSNGFTGIKWHPDGNYFTGNANGNTIPPGAIELIPTKWKWDYNLNGFKDKDWSVIIIIEGLKAQGHTDVAFNYEGNYFTGNATEEIELPPDAIIL